MDQRQHAQPSLRRSGMGSQRMIFRKPLIILAAIATLCITIPIQAAIPATLVKDIYPGVGDSYPGGLKNVNGTLFFGALDENGRRLWQTNGTPDSTKPVDYGASLRDIWPLTNFKNRLYFSATATGYGNELWSTAGTAASTTLVKYINPGAGNSYPMFFMDIGNMVLFSADDGIHGDELWKTDGTPEGTVLVKDINPGATSIYPSFGFVVINQTMFFAADDGVTGRELWKSDGTLEGTVLVKDINPGTGGSISSGFNPGFINVGSVFYFVADDGVHGTELWKSDGTPEGTQLVADVVLGTEGSTPRSLTNVNGTIFFMSYRSGSDHQLWKTGGTAASTAFVAPVGAICGPGCTQLTAVNNLLFFVNFDPTHGLELWRSDGTPAGTTIVKDIFPGSTGSDVGELTSVNGKLIFRAGDGPGINAWQSDGTTEGTFLLADVGQSSGSSFPAEFTLVGNQLFFSARTPSTGRELYVLQLPSVTTNTVFLPMIVQ